MAFLRLTTSKGGKRTTFRGSRLSDPIFWRISAGEFLAADVTYLNENVTFEIGYAIGSKKRCLLFVNSAQSGDHELANRIGVFDTLGYERYENSETLTKLMVNRTDYSSMEFEVGINHQQPVYIVEPAKKNDAHRSSCRARRRRGGSTEVSIPTKTYGCRHWTRSGTLRNRQELLRLSKRHPYKIPESTIFARCLLRAWLSHSKSYAHYSRGRVFSSAGCSRFHKEVQAPG